MPPETDDESNVIAFQRGRIAAALGEPPPADSPAVDVGGGGPHPPGMEFNERLARVEAAIDGLRHSQNLTIGATVGVGAIIAAFIIGFGIYTLQRVDQTQAAISNEAAQTRQELIGIATAISNSITATKQAQPQIIVVPAPAPAGTPK
jgi:hypothetical protein